MVYPTIRSTPLCALAVLLAASTAAAQPPTASFATVDEPQPVAAFPSVAAPAPAASQEVAQPVVAPRPVRWIAQPRDPAASNPETPLERVSSSKAHSDWMLTAEATTHAPIDVAAQSILESQIGLRIGAGIGWMPRPYLDLLSNVAHLASASEHSPTFESGRAVRVQVGLRPFRSFGGYVDAGYARVTVESTARDPTGLTSSYEFRSTIDTWFAEIGYQSLIFGRGVLGFGLGLTAVIDARTKTAAGAESDEVTEQVDASLERYGYIPTFTLRLGLDLI